MKNNNNLILEISKIQKLMTGEVIVEQWSSIIDDVIKMSTKIAGKLPDKVDNLIGLLGKTQNEEEVVKILAKIANNSDDLAEIIIPKIMSTLTDQESKQVIGLKQTFKKLIETGKLTPEEAVEKSNQWIDANVITDFEGVKTAMKKDLKDYITSIKSSKKNVAPPKPKTKYSEPEEVFGQKIGDITPLSVEELRKLDKIYRQKGLGKNFFTSLRKFIRQVEDMMSKETQKIDETLRLIKSYSTSENSLSKVNILDRIGENLETISQKNIKNFEAIDDWIDSNILDYKIKSKIRGEKGYKRAQNLLSPDSVQSWRKTYGSLSERRAKLRTQLNSLLNPASWFGDNIGKWAGSSPSSKRFNKWKAIMNGPEFAELRQWALKGKTLSPEAFDAYEKQFGKIPANIIRAKEYVYSYIVLSACLAGIDFVTDLLANYLRNTPFLNRWEPFQNQVKSFDERFFIPDISKVKSSTGLNKMSEAGGGLILTVVNFLYYFADELEHLPTAIPGFGDDLFAFLYFLSSSHFSTENVENAVSNGNALRNRLRDGIDGLVERAGQVANRTGQGVKYTNDKDGLVKFLGQEYTVRGAQNLYNSPIDRENMSQVGNQWKFKGADGKIRTFKYEENTFTETTPRNEGFINKNSLETKIHTLLKKRLNEQRADTTQPQRPYPFTPEPPRLPQRPGLPAWTNDYTSCLSQMGKILPTKSNEQVVIVDGQIKNFFLKNSTYVIKVGNDEVRGKWECVSGNLIIALTNGNSWSKKTGWVGDYSPFKDGSNNKNTQTDTPNQTKSKYTDCPNTLPIKQYCRNKTIKQVQACLGMPQKYQTGNFGPITQKYLKDAGLDVDKLITQETIETVCKKQPNSSNIQQPNTSNIQQPNTSNIQQPSDNKTQSEKKQPQSITGYEDYTTDEIEYSQPKTSEPSKPPKQNSEPPNNDAPEKDTLPYRKYA